MTASGGSQSRRSILIISLEKGWMSDMYQPLYSAIRKNAWLTEAEDAETAIHLLTSRPPPSAVLFTDGTITCPEGARILTHLIDYVRAGGIAVFGAQFPGTISTQDLGPFFHKWGLTWHSGDYVRTTFALNPSGVPTPLSAAALFPECSMKAVHVKAPRECAVYLPAAGAHTQSLVWASIPITGARAEESPAAFGRVGSGFVGYVGDVNGEQASIRATIEMLGVKIKPGDFGARVITTGMSFRPGQGSTATYAEEEEIPLPASSPSRRPREAEAKARKERRAKVRKEKTSRADALKVEVRAPRREFWGVMMFTVFHQGNALFTREKWVEAADKYHAAAMLAGPQPVYVSNLTAALLKLSL